MSDTQANQLPRNSAAELLAKLETLSPAERAFEAARGLLPEYGRPPEPGERLIDPDDHYIEPWVAVAPEGIREITPEPQKVRGDMVIGYRNQSYLGDREYSCMYVTGALTVYPGFLSDHGDLLSRFMQPAPAHGSRAHGWLRDGYNAKPYTVEADDPNTQQVVLSVSGGSRGTYDPDRERVSIRVSIPGNEGDVTYLLRAHMQDGVATRFGLWRDKPRDPNAPIVELAYEVSLDAPKEVFESAEMQYFAQTHDQVDFDSAEGARVLNTISTIAEMQLRARAERQNY